MTISTTNNAFCNLFFGLSATLGVADTQSFFAENVIKMERGGVMAKTTINTPLPDFVFIKPPPKSRGTFIGFVIYPSAIGRIGKAFRSPYFCFCRVIRAMARFSVGFFHLVWVAFSPMTTGLARAGFLFSGFHAPIIAGFNGEVKSFILANPTSSPRLTNRRNNRPPLRPVAR